MGWLKTALAINGLTFLWRGSLDIVQPTSFYLESGAPTYALDAIRVLGIAYLAFGLIQLGAWRVADRQAVRTVALASMLFAAGVFGQAVAQGSASTDAFHQLSLGAAAENALVALLYAVLLLRESRATRRAGSSADHPRSGRPCEPSIADRLTPFLHQQLGPERPQPPGARHPVR